jgi:hypothetical protein
MSARHTLNYILSDDQMRAHLESGDSLVFERRASHTKRAPSWAETLASEQAP